MQNQGVSDLVGHQHSIGTMVCSDAPCLSEHQHEFLLSVKYIDHACGFGP